MMTSQGGSSSRKSMSLTSSSSQARRKAAAENSGGGGGDSSTHRKSLSASRSMGLTGESIRKPKMEEEEEEGAIYEEEILAAEDERIVYEFAKFLLKIISRQHAQFPADLVANVLVNMGVEYVYTSRRVSRSWHSTISSPAFLREHYHRSTKDLSNYRFVYKCATEEYGYHLRSFDFQSVLNGDPIAVGHPIPASNDIHIVGTCYGTVCVEDCGNLEILNLTTKKSSPLPSWHSTANYSTKILDPVMIVSGFGFVESTDDYVVLGVSYLDRLGFKMLLYCSKAGTWKLLKDPAQFPAGHIVFVSDRFHWQGSCDIVCLDMENERYTSIGLPKYLEPDELRERCFTLGKLKECVSVLCRHARRNHHDVWVLEKNGWTKMFTLEIDLPRSIDRYDIHPTCILPNENLLFRILGGRYSFFVYDVENGTFRMLHLRGGLSYPQVGDFYVESMFHLLAGSKSLRRL